MLLKELQQLSEAKANISKAIKYLASLGVDVDPRPVSSDDGKIVFEVPGKTAKEIFHQLDSISYPDDGVGYENDPQYKIWAGQGLSNYAGYWYDKDSKNFSREIYLDNHPLHGVTITLSYEPEREHE